MRFKIDLNECSSFPFGLYVMRDVTLFLRLTKVWRKVESLRTREEAIAHINALVRPSTPRWLSLSQ